ncbi:hypothetical protein SNEBB_001380 [Seison nebaliae]|nr:hypothetical protein SNEBB_001380 [Seison nebaliae]
MDPDYVYEKFLQILQEKKSSDLDVNNYLGEFWKKENRKKNKYSEIDKQTLNEMYNRFVQKEKMVKLIVDQFLFQEIGENTLQKDIKELQFSTFLLFIEVKNLRKIDFQNIFLINTNYRNVQFLQFLLNKTFVKMRLSRKLDELYESDHIKENIIDPFLNKLTYFEELVEKLKEERNPYEDKVLEKKFTESEEFKLHENRKKKNLPIYEKVDIPPKVHEVPASTYVKPKNFSEKQPRQKFSKEIKTTVSKGKKKEIFADEVEMEKSMFVAQPVKKEKQFPNMKLNTATILREGAILDKKKKIIIEQIDYLRSGGKDLNEHEEYLEKIRFENEEEDNIKKETNILRGKISYEEAIMAKKEIIERKKDIRKQFDQENEELIKQAMIEKLESDKKLTQIVASVVNCRNNAIEEKKKLFEYKRQLVKEQQEERRKEMENALKEAEEEMRRKILIINEIRAFESLRSNVSDRKDKVLDLTTTGGYGFLNEISIFELRERLSWLKVEEEKELQKKRNEIHQRKQEKDEEILQKLNDVNQYKKEKSNIERRSVENLTFHSHN